MWDVAQKKEIASFVPWPYPVRSLAFSNDGKVLASGGVKTVEIWDLEKKGIRSTHNVGTLVPGPDSLVRRPNGEFMAACSHHEAPFLTLWDVEKGKDHCERNRGHL